MAVTNSHYSLSIIESSTNHLIVPRDKMVCPLKHNSEYKVFIHNHHPTHKCTADVTIDGKSVGLFRINQASSITLERPSDRARKFVFYKCGTVEAKQAAICENNPYLGDVVVKITKEKKVPVQPVLFSCYQSDGYDEVDGGCEQSDSCGGTGLGEASSQRFVTVQPLNMETESIYLRCLLVHDSSSSEEAYVDYQKISPL